MRTIFLGSSAFAVEVLQTLAGSRHRPTLAITPPDRPRGRGRRIASPPAAEAARGLGLELLQTPNVNGEQELATIEHHEPEAVCVCEFGQLITEPLLSRYTLLNVHPSLLPRWRGAAPIERALMAGDSETGVTIFRLEEGWDSGPLALAKPLPVGSADTAGALRARLAEIGGTLLVDALDRLERGELEFVEQDHDQATYAAKIEPAERRLDPALPASQLERIVRALTPNVGAYVSIGDERLGVLAAAVAEEPPEGLAEPPAAGELRAQDGRIFLGTAAGTLELTEVQAPGKRPMPAADYLRGHALPAPADG